jgi:hypothetical protein
MPSGAVSTSTALGTVGSRATSRSNQLQAAAGWMGYVARNAALKKQGRLATLASGLAACAHSAAAQSLAARVLPGKA